MGLAGAAVADGDDVFTALDVFTPGQFHHQGLVQRRDGREVESVQGFHGRESGRPYAPLHHALVAVDEFQLGQPEQAGGVVHIFGGALCGHLPVFPEKGGQPEFLQVMFQQQRRPVVHAALPDSKGMYSPADVVLTRTRGR